ncbi:hypothetical protein [Miniphocaeibacter massiliensis]|uniref:hypothetical protein n=1 Tax=Miniphocaeibacter massiliensis TaxID=2041841 RepID=UPI000C1BAAC7|nr:hypothetical protein [Miniphocaeibacter massiliensis]
MKKKILVLCLAIMMLFTACGNGDEKKETKEKTTAEATTKTTEIATNEMEPSTEVDKPTEEEIKIFDYYRGKHSELSETLAKKYAQKGASADVLKQMQEEVIKEEEVLMEQVAKEYGKTIDEIKDILFKVGRYQTISEE